MAKKISKSKVLAEQALKLSDSEFSSFVDHISEAKKTKKTKPKAKPKGSKHRMTKASIDRIVKEAISLHSKKSLVEHYVRTEIDAQVKNRTLIESILTEGPLSGMFRAGASALGQAAKGVGGALKSGAQNVANAVRTAGADESQRKAVIGQVSAVQKSLAKSRDSFNSEILKTSSAISAYHDAILAYVQTIQAVLPNMSEMDADRLSKESSQALNQFYYDLKSEKEGIDSFMKSLEKASSDAVGSGLRATKGKKDAEAGREEEASQYGRSRMSQLAGATRNINRR
jgi:hypothetical protein